MEDDFDSAEDRTVFLRDLVEAPMTNGKTTTFLFGDPAKPLHTVRIHGVVRKQIRQKSEGGGLKKQILLLDDTTHVLPVLIPNSVYARSFDGPLERGEFCVFYGELQKITPECRQLVENFLGGDVSRLVLASEYRRIKATEDKNEKLQTLLRYESYFDKFPLCQTEVPETVSTGDRKEEKSEVNVEEVLNIIKENPLGITMSDLMARIRVSPAIMVQMQEQGDVWFNDGKFKIL